MTTEDLEQTIIKGIFTLGNHILISPECLHMRKELVDDNRIMLCRNVILYIDKNGITENFPQARYEMRPLAFATLMTPVCDITISQGEVYSISYKHVHEVGVFPQSIDIEEVLTEVDRVAFTFDAEFNTARVLRLSRHKLDPRFNQPKRSLIE